MSSEQQNGLVNAASTYLRTAQHQPVAWHEWGAEAFAQAEREDKPVLLDIGAVWCHWCHVMDRESYEDPATAAVINEHYIAVKVDRDERPDVDTRYQAAIAAISGQGGWPLTAFLTPAGVPFFGGGYFPVEERYGRPSFRRVLLTMAEAFRNRRGEVEESAGSVLSAIEHNESFTAPGERLAEAFGRELLDKLVGATLAQFDPKHGGFGSQPKFPHAAALDLLLDAATRGGVQAEQAERVARITLEKMAAGGIYDHLAGGFHRYSVDERWHVPHFEKMAYDNSELLKAYVHGWETLREPRFAEVATGILRWMDEWLSDRERGGFYASQDADASLHDDGGYFTWTEDEAGAVLAAEEFRAAKLCFNLRAVGDMHDDAAKNVLQRRLDRAELAAALGLPQADADELFSRAQAAMYAARLQRPTPRIDRTIYTGWNGMCISAYLVAGRSLQRADAVQFALKSLDRVLAEAWDPQRGLIHVVRYAEGIASTTPVAAGLEDYVFLAQAALDAFECSGELRFVDTARHLTDTLVERFYDEAAGGFFDTEQASSLSASMGVLQVRRKPSQDAPSPAGNAVAAAILLRLGALTGDLSYEDRAHATLQTFAGVAEHFGLYAASYGLALRRWTEPPLQICVLGDDQVADDLAAAAEHTFSVNKSVLRLRHDQLRTLPAALAQSLPHLPTEQGSVAVVCRGAACLPPVTTAKELRAQLANSRPAYAL